MHEKGDHLFGQKLKAVRQLKDIRQLQTVK